MKYTAEDICPTKINGGSTGLLPIHIRITKLPIVSQNSIWFNGR